MKTSNYIILSFFTLLFGGIFVLFLAAEIDSTPYQNAKLETLEQPLDSFSVVVAQSGAQINLTIGTTTKIMKVYPKGQAIQLPPFIVRNDTLFVGANSSEDQHPTAQITYKQLNAIQGEEQSRITLDQFYTDTFNITMQAGNLFYIGNNLSPGKNNLNIHANQGAHINLQTSKIKELNLYIDHSELEIFNATIDKLYGTVKNESRCMNFASIYKINLEVDSTSSFSINKR